MLISYNEVGFKEANIKALCYIGDSIKKIKDYTKGYIREKGISFKSIFKVANIIHISLKGYRFRLN
jgi:hypothetical protein